MKNSSSTTLQTPGELLNDLHALVAEGQKMITDSVSGHTQEAVGALRARFASTQQRASELYTDAKEKVIAGAHYTDETIRAKPYQSLAIVAGIGLIVGILIGRRGR